MPREIGSDEGGIIYSVRRLAFLCVPRPERDISRRLIEVQERAGGQRVASNRDSIRALARSLLPPLRSRFAAPLEFNYSGRRSRILPIDRAPKSSALSLLSRMEEIIAISNPLFSVKLESAASEGLLIRNESR